MVEPVDPFQSCKLDGLKPDHTATVVADEGNGRELARQDIPLTDFPLDEVSLYLTGSTLLLPSEY